MNRRHQLWKSTVVALSVATALLLHLWAGLALYFWFGSHAGLAITVAAGYAVLVLLVWRMAKTRAHGLWAGLLLFLVVAVWWMRREPETGLSYPQETEQAARLEIDGGFLTVHAMRDFRYRTPQDYHARWTTRTYDLAKLRHVDLLFNNWGIPGVDHVITSFVFEDQPPLAVSIELRCEKDEPNTLLRGLFKQYELFYVWADERDLVGLRANHRKEQVSLYRTRVEGPAARRLLTDMVLRSNELLETPEFYNTLTDNCTNVIARHVNRISGHEVPWYRQPLRTGKYVRMGYNQGWLVNTQPWEEFLGSAVINARAQADGEAGDFSKRIRTHLPAAVMSEEQYPSQ